MSESAVDRLAVIETCTRMAWHADQREWDALRDVFAEEVLLDYTSLQGGEPATVSREQLVESWAGLLGKLQATQHLVTNHLVNVSEDTASCTATFQATHLLPSAHGDPIWTLGGSGVSFTLYRPERRQGIPLTVVFEREGTVIELNSQNLDEEALLELAASMQRLG